MALQILPDLHLESPKLYDIFPIAPKSPILALLGDIGTLGPHKTDLLSFLQTQLKQYQAVLFNFQNEVSQNASLGTFVLLDRASYQIPETKTMILGCSLFSCIPEEDAMEVEMRLNDFYSTEDWTVPQHNAAHTRDLQWLNEQVSVLEHLETIENIIILTHWSPSTEARAMDPKHKGSPITSAFSTDLTRELCFQSEKVKFWGFGHTHWNCDFGVERGGGKDALRLATNQRGYSFAQADSFAMDWTISL
ncbi:calcineurin-like phosphoesterase [Teratosphaeria destructans]|uniref:Calcineurin-like phosphoesterase n=1 Tax=Teratosphaeria destructans TaxID=418781 RepID=A0A9W7SUQ5_9PEZI|nr:calcineurin-like phosphoesterase [Teratosphaeria destructans]